MAVAKDSESQYVSGGFARPIEVYNFGWVTEVFLKSALRVVVGIAH